MPGLLLTCEHAGFEIPPSWRDLVAIPRQVLTSHRGYDRGAWEAARTLADALRAPLIGSHLTRLLIDLNRSERHPRLFSEFVRPLPAEQRQRLLEEIHRPYRAEVRASLQRIVQRRGAVLHVSVHSFTPVLRGRRRRADLGLLYDPSRRAEKTLAESWRGALRDALPALTVRMNYPYRGAADGLTTALRREFAAAEYLGLELEINQRFARTSAARFSKLSAALAETLRQAWPEAIPR